MYQILTIVFLAATVGLLAAHYVLSVRRRAALDRAEPCTVRRHNAWERLVLLVLAVSFLALAVTGFIPAICGWSLVGYLLMAHCTAAPVFAAALAAMAVTWAEGCRFEDHDLQWLRRGGGCCSRGADAPPAGRFDAGQKICFWLGGLLGAVVVLSMVICMVPVFGSAWQDICLEVHRGGALALLVVALVHVYRATLAKSVRWRALVSGRVSESWAKRHHPVWWQRLRDEDER